MNEQEIFNALREAERRILPAKLVDPAKDGKNGFAIAGYLSQHKLSPNADNFHTAITALASSLEWLEPIS